MKSKHLRHIEKIHQFKQKKRKNLIHLVLVQNFYRSGDLDRLLTGPPFLRPKKRINLTDAAVVLTELTEQTVWPTIYEFIRENVRTRVRSVRTGRRLKITWRDTFEPTREINLINALNARIHRPTAVHWKDMCETTRGIVLTLVLTVLIDLYRGVQSPNMSLPILGIDHLLADTAIIGQLTMRL